MTHPAEKDASLYERVKGECERLAQSADRYDQAGQHEYAGGLREASHHVLSILADAEPVPAQHGAPECSACGVELSEDGGCWWCDDGPEPTRVTPPEGKDS